MSLLDRRDWVYLLTLLVPLVAYDLALKIVGLASEQPGSGVRDALRMLRSDLLFNGGYVLVWIGLFAVARWGIPRRVLLVLFHASAILVVVIATVAYQYFRSTGTVLDYGVVAYYLDKPSEAQGAVSSDAPVGAWLVLSAALLYALPGPLLLTRALLSIGASGGSTDRLTEDGGDDTSRRGRTPRRALTRQEFLTAGAGAAAGMLLLKESLSPAEAGAEAAFSRDPVSNLVATELEQSRLDEAAKNATARHPLAKARLKPTPRTHRRHVALIHLESPRASAP